jgi:uncharacterized RDD family membrane protein YckC
MELYQEDRELVPRAAPKWRGYVLSGWWRRAGAFVIDWFIVGAISVLIVILLGEELDSISLGHVEWFLILAATLPSLVYFPVIMRATDGRTLGKMATRIRVVRTDSERMSLTRATWREVVLKTFVVTLLPGLLGVLWLLDDLWPLWDRENRAIHDMLAATRVVRTDLPQT